MLPPAESRWICTARLIKVRKKTGQIERQTDGHQTITICLQLDTANAINDCCCNVIFNSCVQFTVEISDSWCSGSERPSRQAGDYQCKAGQWSFSVCFQKINYTNVSQGDIQDISFSARPLSWRTLAERRHWADETELTSRVSWVTWFHLDMTSGPADLGNCCRHPRW